MLKVLINAYACSPYMGSEPGMAWNWCANLAKYCELFIITEGEFRDKIESIMLTLPQEGNMHFYYLPIGGNDNLKSEKIRKMCWNQGDWRFYWYYAKWQKRALKLAQEIVDKEQIDVLHQLNMIGFREPGLLWKIKGIPYIWGPTNAKEAFPTSFLEGVELKKKLFIHIKNTITQYQLKHSSKVRNAASRASLIIASSTDSANSIKKYLAVEPLMINESGCEKGGEFLKKDNKKSTFDLLWVGRLIFTKQLNLALKALSMVHIPNLRLHIVGGTCDEERTFKMMADKLGVANQCVWHQRVDHDEVQKLMRSSDLFFFTSIAEGTPHVILEAFNNCLPVLCFDTCGQGDCVNETVGVKIQLTNPVRSVRNFAEQIERLYNHRDILDQMSQNCRKRAEELSWDNKVRQMVDVYHKILDREQ